MKRHLLSLLVPAIMFSGAVSAIEIVNNTDTKVKLGGKATGMHYFSKDKGSQGDQSSFELDLSGETQINKSISGYGRWVQKFGLSASEDDSSSKNWVKLGYAGIRYNDMTTFDYGRNSGIIYDVTSITDTLPEFGGGNTTNDNFLSNRANSVATLRHKGFFGSVDGLDFALQFQGKNGGDGHLKDGSDADMTSNARKISRQNGNGMGASVSYDFGNGISGVAAFAHSKRTNGQISAGEVKGSEIASGKWGESYAAGLKYDANNLYLAANVAQHHNMFAYGNGGMSEMGGGGLAKKSLNTEIVAQYHFDYGLMPSVAFVYANGKNLNTKHAKDGKHALVKYAEVGAKYSFNENLSAAIDHKINLLKKDDFTENNKIATDNITSLSISYLF